MVLMLNVTGLSLASASSQLSFEPCQVVKNSVFVDAECAVLERAENPNLVAEEGNEKVALHIVKFAARTPEPAADAFTIIQGGPGMSSIDLYLSMRQVFAGVLAKRDIIVVDQRGTGRSNLLSCPQNDALNTGEFNEELTKQFARECLAALTSNPEFYTTSIAVQDLDAMRELAGYPQLTVYGVSYGTRVAQHYARQFPSRTRALVLDGVAHVGLNLAGAEIALRSQQAFDRILSRCSAEPSCNGNYGDLGSKFSELRARLRENPVTINFPHPISGDFIEQELTEQHLLGTVRLMPYATESLALLPLILTQAHAGNYVPMAAQAVLVEQQFEKDYAYAMNNAVVCTEDAPFLTEEDLKGHESTYFGADLSKNMQALCEVWPQGVMDENFRAPFESSIPTLLLSGETDPVTPPKNGELAAAMFSNSLHIVVPHHGHGVVGRGCLPQLTTEFIESGSVAELPTECANRERAMPLFTSPTGPTP